LAQAGTIASDEQYRATKESWYCCQSRCGRIVPELSRPDVREIFHGAYRIIYGISKGEVHILTVRHGKIILDAAETTEV
jgi:plasmid stabilization system protein ParE